MTRVYLLAGLILLTMGSAGLFFYLNHYKPLSVQVKHLTRENQTLRQQVETIQQELNQKVMALSKVEEEKKAEIARIQSAKDSLIAEMQEEIEKNQIQITQLADKLNVRIVDRILFPSGEATISEDGMKVLERVGNILKNVQDKMVRVEGHTDNVPIGDRLKSKFPSNWELSTARATNVVRFLQEKIGMDPSRLEAVGLGEYRPVASNATASGRAQNRRIEIVLLPR